MEKIFFVYNKPFSINQRTFKFLSYFEKIFLVLFYKKGWFERSVAYLYRMKDIQEYRRKNYPLINMFYLYSDKSECKFESLKIIANQYKFFYLSEFFGPRLKKVNNNFFAISTNKFVNFLIMQKLSFKKYWNTFSSSFFKEYLPNNSFILSFIFSVFLINAKYKLKIYDLSNWKDWHSYTFRKNVVSRFNFKRIIIKYKTKFKEKDRSYKIDLLVYRYRQYKIRYMVISRLLKREFVNLVFFKFDFSSFFKVRINNYLNILLNNYYLIKFSESSVSKYINSSNLKNYNFYFLRKNRIFNKGRYSRNRQLYRTGVYWCLWLNIIMVYGLYFIFYRFSFNFGYIWWGILILAYSTIFSRIVKFNFYNPFYLYKEFLSLQRWYGYIMRTCIYYFDNYLKNHFLTANLYNHLYKYQKSKWYLFFNNYYYYTSKVFFYWLKKKENMKIVFLWQGMKEVDKSFLRYKTVLHWIKETYRMFTTW